MLIFMEGFDCYGTNGQDITNNLVAAGYVDYAGSKVATSNTRSGLGYAMQITGLGGKSLLLNTVALTEFYFGFGVNFARFDIPAVDTFFVFNYDNSFGTLQTQFQLNVSDTGSISVSGIGGLLGATDPGTVQNNAWHWLEGHVVVNGTEGIVTLQIDGANVLTLSGLNLVNTEVPAKVNQFQFTSNYGNFGEGHAFDDFYLCDTTGDSLNTFLGDNIVYGFTPNADAGTNNMTQVGGGVGHFTAIDQITPDGDTSYVTSNIDGTTELYTIPNLPGNAIDVLAVQVSINARREAGGIAKAAGVISDGVHQVVADPRTYPNTYAIRTFIFPAAPDGGGWTVGKVNTPLQVGVQVAA